MKRLGSVEFDRAREAILRDGRDLDVALYEYHFEDGDRERVIAELATYQNDDGGFGNAIEPDVRYAGSSPLATSVGLQYAIEVDLAPDHHLIETAISYLKRTYRWDEGYWPFSIPEVTSAPHAPWWYVEDVTPPTEQEWPNPNAQLLGYLWRSRSIVPQDLLESVTERAEKHLDSVDHVDASDARRYAILCWERGLPWLPTDLADRVRAMLDRTLERIDWQDELAELRTSAFAFSPETTVARQYPEQVDRHLELEIVEQASDGGWWPEWEWGQYETDWAVAEREWVGKLTLDCLLALDRFDKLDRDAA